MRDSSAMRRDGHSGSDPVPVFPTRREFLVWSGAALVAVGLVRTDEALAADDAPAFSAGSLDDVLAALGGRPSEGTQVIVSVPDFVENGAIVPVEVTTEFPGEQSIYIVSELNPYPLVAKFSIPAGTQGFVSTRIKVGESCKIYAIVREGGKLYWASKATSVTVGGCGG